MQQGCLLLHSNFVVHLATTVSQSKLKGCKLKEVMFANTYDFLSYSVHIQLINRLLVIVCKWCDSVLVVSPGHGTLQITFITENEPSLLGFIADVMKCNQPTWQTLTCLRCC